MKPQKPVAGFCSKNKTKPSVVEVHVSCLLSSNKKAFAFTNYRSAAQPSPAQVDAQRWTAGSCSGEVHYLAWQQH